VTPPTTPATSPTGADSHRSPRRRHPRRHAHRVQDHEQHHEAAERERHGLRTELRQRRRAEDGPGGAGEEQRPQAPNRRREPAPPTRLDPVHHEVRDDQDRDRRLHVEEERQERRAERGKAEADGPLHERGDENGEGGA